MPLHSCFYKFKLRCDGANYYGDKGTCEDSYPKQSKTVKIKVSMPFLHRSRNKHVHRTAQLVTVMQVLL